VLRGFCRFWTSSFSF